MPEESAGIPLAEILRTANELVLSGLIKDYALGGALAAMRYVEPFATYDADIFFIPVTEDSSAGVHDIYEALRAHGCEVEGDHLLLNNFPVQFLAAHGLTKEARAKRGHHRISGRSREALSARIHDRHRGECAASQRCRSDQVAPGASGDRQKFVRVDSEPP